MSYLPPPIDSSSGVPSLRTVGSLHPTAKTGTALAAAIAAAGTNKKVWVLSPGETWDIDVSVTIPTNIETIVYAGASISKSGTGSLTINGPFQAPTVQIFSGFSAGDITFNVKALDYVFPQWWGANGNGTDNDAPEVIAAVATGRDVYFLSGTYMISQGVTLSTAGQRLVGSGQAILVAGATPMTMITITGARAKIEDVHLRSWYSGNTIVHITGANFVSLNKVRISGAGGYTANTWGTDKGLVFSNTSYLTLDTCIVENCPVGIYEDSGPTVYNGTLHCVNCHIDKNKIGLDINKHLVFIGGTLSHNSLHEMELGTRIDWTDTIRARARFIGTHIELDGTRDEYSDGYSMIFGNSGLTGSDDSAIDFTDCIIFMNDTTRYLVDARNKGRITLMNCSVSGTHNGNEGLILDSGGTLEQVLIYNTSQVNLYSNPAIPWVKNYSGRSINYELLSTNPSAVQAPWSMGDIYPKTDNTHYLGRNDDELPKAWKGVILKDTTDGKYYRIEVVNGVVTATDLSI